MIEIIRNGHYILCIVLLYKIILSEESDNKLDGINVGSREIPPELQGMFKNKTDYEVKMEECMEDFTECLRLHSPAALHICAVNPLGDKRSFYTLCEMFYENCKLDDEKDYWRYFDDSCNTDATR